MRRPISAEDGNRYDRRSYTFLTLADQEVSSPAPAGAGWTAATALSLIAMPAMAQTTKTDGGHHHGGGPKSDASHHMGKKNVDTTTTGQAKPSGSHHYSGGPREMHHIGPK